MDKILRAANAIEEELAERVEYFKSEDKLLEAQRIAERTNYDVEMLRETGFCSGVENYSRHLAGMPAGATPHTLMDYFGDDYLLIIDESHKTVPQVRAMYVGDQSRKTTLVDYGFRLPSAKGQTVRWKILMKFESKLDQVLLCICDARRLRGGARAAAGVADHPSDRAAGSGGRGASCGGTD